VTIGSTAGLLNNDVVVIDPLAAVGQREYVQIAPERADGIIQASAPNGDPSGSAVKLNFKTPLRYAHASGVTITKVTLALRQEGGLGNDYGLTPATGTITANVAFSAGVGMVMSYRSDARFGYWVDNTGLPGAHVTSYVPPANDSTDIGQEQGDWQGLPYQDGTYTADLWVAKNLDLGLQNELQTYRSTSNAGTLDFLYGAATEIVPHQIISSSANCYTCHNDVIFHGGGRRGLDACLTCHSISGNEDKPRWDTPNQANAAPAIVPTQLTPRVAIEFRQMLHKIHKGSELFYADTYTVVGNGGNPSTYGEVEFPAMPGGVRQCIRCHGNDAWKQPAIRAHDSADVPVRVWGDVCGACHDADAAQAHIQVQTSPTGFESCEVCHGIGRDWNVEKMHHPH
jgi:Outer membrane cytochrome MtrC/MtrF-like, domains II/IV